MNDEPGVNPAIPTTVGALLTEEVAMNPFTPLPSFYEMMLIEEAQRSARKALTDGMESVARHLSRQRTQQSLTTSLFGKVRNRVFHFVEFLVKKYGPEVRLLIIYLVERQFIMTSSATMAESVYGGKRAKSDNGRLGPMTRPDQTRLAVMLALSWYADEKCDALFRKWSPIVSSHSQHNDRRRKIKEFFLKIYPFLQMTKHGSVLAYQFLYLLGKTVYFHPTSHLLGTVVRRLTQADIANTESASSDTREKSSATQQALQKWTPRIRKAALWAASTTLVLGWIQQWRQYVRAQEQEQRHISNRLIPPPPEAPPLKLNPRQRIRIPENSDVCPLCQQPWIAPSASPAGYVFCHKCLVLYVREYKQCPLTGALCLEADIVRIYEPQASAA